MSWIILLKIIEYAVLVLLLGLSIWSIAIIIDRKRVFESLQSELRADELKELIRDSSWSKFDSFSTGSGLLAEWVAFIRGGTSPEKIDRATRSFLTDKRRELEKGMNVLATLGSNAPFIGLFGTVLGIVQAFAVLSSDQGGSASVMSSIAAALVATAAGLFVAIPAVIAYNFFNEKLQQAMSVCDSVKDLYLSKKDLAG